LPYVEELVKQIGTDKMEVALLRVCEPPRIHRITPAICP
jgi:hypothetical protein